MLDRRLLIVTGKGGVGRSAVTAALALAAAARGARVLALAMEDGRGLARHLGRQRIGTEPVPKAGVHAAAIDPTEALDEYLRLRTRAPRIGAVTRVFSAVAESVPGVRDTIVTGKVIFEATRDRWDLVVTDAPPVGQIMSYLQAPATIEGLVPSGAVREQATSMRDTLANPRHTGIVLVATPSELAVSEATEAAAAVTAEGISVAARIANMTVDGVGDSSGLAGEPPGPRLDAARFADALRAEQTPHLASFAPDLVLPLVLGSEGAADTARALAERWPDS